MPSLCWTQMHRSMVCIRRKGENVKRKAEKDMNFENVIDCQFPIADSRFPEPEVYND